MSWYHLFFHWPDGGVWSNIVASVIWALPPASVAYWRARVHRRHHAASLNELHAKIDQLRSFHGLTNDTTDLPTTRQSTPIGTSETPDTAPR